MALLRVRESCCKDEEFAKSFMPSLFDSDSDTDEAYCLNAIADKCSLPDFSLHPHTHLQVCIGKPMQKTTSCEAFSKANFKSKLQQSKVDRSIKEELQEASSPSSQGNSSVFSLSPFQTSTLESSESLDSTSPFCSVLSFESCDSVLEFDSKTSFVEGHSPNKKQKIEHSEAQDTSCLRVASPPPVESLGKPPLSSQQIPACNSFATARSLPVQPRMASPLMSRASAPISANIPYMHPTLSGGITTGIPVDSCPTEVNKLWPNPQVMVPMQPLAAFYPHQYHTTQPTTPPQTTPERVFAALAEVQHSSATKLPIGLKLDTSSVALGLRGIGMCLKDN